MASSCSLQLSYGLGICKRHERSAKFKRFDRNGQTQALCFHLSSQASMLDAWSFQRVHEVYHPRRFASSAYRKLSGQSFNMQMRRDTVPVYKAVVLALSRVGIMLTETSFEVLAHFERSKFGLDMEVDYSHNADVLPASLGSVNTLTSGSHLLHQLTPAVGVIAFALWGLGPLVHFVHHMFFHCNENSWRKCKTNYVLNSYLQPLMLWTGATFLCRVLDPVILPTEASQVVKQRILNFVKSLSTVLAFAYCLSSLIRQTQSFFMETNGSDDTRNMGFQFAGKAVYSAVWVAAVSLFMELLGFSTQKWLTAGGLGTVLLTLAGREIFTNFLSSAMIHATRPFVLNEWIQTKIEGYEVSGTVEHVGWWSPTIIRGEDREVLHIPNHKFTVNVVRNLSQKTHWRIKTHLAISHMDVNKINSIVADMRKVLAKNPQVEHKKLHRRVFLENIDRENQALLIVISCFVKTSHFEEYLCVKERVLLDLLRVIRHHRARLATPIRTVQKIYGDADIENIPFAETIFSRAGVNKNRPFLLIEPSSKVNSDDKAKSRSSRSNEENDNIKRQNPESKAIPSDSPAQASPELKQVNKKSKDSTIKADEPSATNAPTVSLSSESAEVTTGVDSISNPKEGIKLGIPAEKPLVPNTDKDKVDGPTISDPSQGKVDGEAPVLSTPTPRSALEENLVLGVALDGSKRVLPIEEERVEQREEEGHNPIMSNAAASDLREQDR